MNANDPNASMLERVAEQLGDALRQDMVFVGGAVAGLLITDPAMPAIRPTEDVDLIFEALVLADFHRFEKTLRARGFVPDQRPDAPICRWRVGELAVDVMPTLESVLGFSLERRWREPLRQRRNTHQPRATPWVRCAWVWGSPERAQPGNRHTMKPKPSPWIDRVMPFQGWGGVRPKPRALPWAIELRRRRRESLRQRRNILRRIAGLPSS